MTSSDEPTGSVAPGVSRRRFLQATGLGAADSSAALPAGWSGTIRDVTHVVILMQENRSFDHYFGTFRGVRGFGDKQILTYANGTSVFAQPDKGRTDLGYLLPYNLTDQVHGDLDHSWVGDHAARNGGLWNNWVAAKTEETMGYFTRNEIPFQYALADAFTICDGYHQSIMGPTSPNGCTCGRARRAASSPTRTTTRWTSGLTPARARSRPTPGVVDRRPGGLQRAPVLHPRLRGALREHRASDAVLEPRSVEEHGAVRHLRRARRVLRSPAPAVPGGDRHRRVHRGTADRPWYPGPDDHLLAVDPRRLRRLQRLRPHLGAPVPGHLGRGEAGQRHLVPT